MPLEPALPGHRISQWLFLRLLALVYLVAFVSFWPQARGLVGPRGILPLAPYLRAVATQTGGSRFWDLPTLSWLDPVHPPLGSLALAGALLAALALLGVAPWPCLAGAWLLYVSLVSDGQTFMDYQWDNLLLEAGLAALLVAPRRLRSRLADDPDPPRAGRWLLYWLLFRLVFGSGFVKLASGDPHWRDFTALDFHYWTQPLPLWTSWYAHLLPEWFQRVSCLAVLALELGSPWLILWPKARPTAFWAVAGLMSLIAATGNYCFFNLLTVALALTLLDDAFWPAALRRRLAPLAPPPARSGPANPAGGATAAAAALFLLGLPLFLAQLGAQPDWPRALLEVEDAVAPWRSVNTYGLFAQMTTQRREIVLEGSDDGTAWKEYGFRWKPGSLTRRPGLVAPFQPRLDWQLWFAALGSPQDNPWFDAFCARLLQGSPDVLALLGRNPFPDHPPRYLRPLLYDYHFTDQTTRRATGDWWSRTLVGAYGPTLSLSGGAQGRDEGL